MQASQCIAIAQPVQPITIVRVDDETVIRDSHRCIMREARSTAKKRQGSQR